MKHGLLVLATAVLFACGAEYTKEEIQNSSIDPSSPLTFDSTYAATLGADDYGMRKYVLVLLRKGPNRDQDSTEAAHLQRAHLDNMQQWADDGLLVVAGPTYNHSTTLQGIYIFALNDVEEVEALTRTDPAVKAGRLVMESYPWYSSAALVDVNRIHELISKEKI